MAHNKKRQRLDRIFSGMKDRCYNVRSKAYPQWGGRGVTIHPCWSTAKEFKDWALANGYDDTLTIDRIDNDGNYEPSNCRWVDIKVQSNNRRGNLWVEIGGQLIHYMAALERYNIHNLHETTIRKRLNLGWNPVDAFTTPMSYTKVKGWIEIGGQQKKQGSFKTGRPPAKRKPRNTSKNLTM